MVNRKWEMGEAGFNRSPFTIHHLLQYLDGVLLIRVNANIGRRSDGFYFNGIIDDVRIYNRPLSAAEIISDMNTPLP